MIGRRITGIFILLFLGLPLAAQPDTDSLKELLTSGISNKKEAEVASQLARKYLFHDAKESLRYAYVAYEAALKTGDPKAINNALLQIGNVYALKNAYHTAIEYYHNILANLENCDCPGLSAETNMFLGQTFNELEEYDSALVYLKRAKKLSTSDTLESMSQSTLLLFISEAEMNKNIFDSAYAYIRESLAWFKERQDTSGMINAMNYLVRYYDRLGNYDREEEILKKMYAMASKAGYSTHLCRLNLDMASLYLKKKDPRKAYVYLKKDVFCLKKYNLPHARARYLELLADYYATLGFYSHAISFTENLKNYTDSLQREQLKVIRDLFDIRYDMETKIKSLSLLKRDNRIRNLTYKRNLFYKNISRMSLLFVGLVFLVLFYIFLVSKRSHRQLLETNKKLESVHKKLEQKQRLQQQENQIRNKLFMILAHDLINPFNALLGFAELLSEEIHNFERKDIKRHSEFIYQASKQLHFLLENLLHWARIQTGRILFQPAYIDINKTIRDVTEVYRYSAEKKKITLMINTADDLIVYADESLISVILRNLIHNAIKYTDELGVVTVEASRHDDKVTVSVTDTGCGISEEDRKKLFNLEHHFTRKGTSGEEGTGLGLIICKEFLAFHSASLTIESTPGEGSRFSFSLPVKK